MYLYHFIQFMLRDDTFGRKIRNAKNDCKNTLLHVAAFHGNIEAVMALMDERAPAAVKNNESKTPLHLAAVNGHAR